MEAALPLSSFQVKQHLSLPIQITPPFRVIIVFKMSPGVVMDFLKPVETFL